MARGGGGKYGSAGSSSAATAGRHKKGPRGKRAREKAKLERRWGIPENDDNDGARKRTRAREGRRNDERGNNNNDNGGSGRKRSRDQEAQGGVGGATDGRGRRFLPPRSTEEEEYDEYDDANKYVDDNFRDNGDSSSSSSSSSSSPSCLDDDGATSTLKKNTMTRPQGDGRDDLEALLRRIGRDRRAGKGKNCTNKGDMRGAGQGDLKGGGGRQRQEWGGHVDDDDDDSDDSDDDGASIASSSSTSSSSCSSTSSYDTDAKDDTALSDEGFAPSSMADPYTLHFSRPPLPDNALHDDDKNNGNGISGNGSNGIDDRELSVPIVEHEMRKVDGNSGLGLPHLDSKLEVSISRDLWNKWANVGIANGNANSDAHAHAHANANSNANAANGENKEAEKKNRMLDRQPWYRLVSGSYSRVRKMLRESWKMVNSTSMKKDNANSYFSSSSSSSSSKKKKKKKKKKEQGNDDNDGHRTDARGNHPPLTNMQSMIYPALSSYCDVCLMSIERTYNQRLAIHDLLALHVLNHALTSRFRITKHDRSIRRLVNHENDNDDVDNDDDDDKSEDEKENSVDPEKEREKKEELWKDQGYCRPTVLVLLPTRGTCLDFVNRMLSILFQHDNNGNGSGGGGGGGDGNGGSARDAKSRSRTNGTTNANQKYSSHHHRHHDKMIENYDRFLSEYGVEKDDDDQNENGGPSSSRRESVLNAKGKEWKALFGDKVNSDDDFKIGLSFRTTPSGSGHGKKGAAAAATNEEGKRGKKDNGRRDKISVKLYQEFYHSDIILASPLGLKMAISRRRRKARSSDNGGGGGAKEGEEEDVDDDGDYDSNDDEDDENNASGPLSHKGDIDFLSSIEVCMLLRSDVMLMQNWDHVNSILACVNRQPRHIHPSTDFSRVRPYLLAGQARYWRQTVLLSSISDPNLKSTFKKHATSVEGRMVVKRKVGNDSASVCDVWIDGLKQVFRKVPTSYSSSSPPSSSYLTTATTIAEVPLTGPATRGYDLLRYFERNVLPRLSRMGMKHTLIYIPSYFDFVALRNVLLKTDASFVCVTEYARISEVTRGRARFLQGRKNIMLYTGRAHFFLRHNIKGAKHVIFFGLPEHPEFYSGIVNMLSWGAASRMDGFLADGCGVKDTDGNGREGGMDAVAFDGGESGVGGGGCSCLALYTKYDAHALEGIVGTANCKRMIGGEKGTFLFRS